MKEELLRLFPEILWIKDAGLREAVINTHLDALQEGGWAVADLQRMPFAKSFPNCPVSYLSHMRAVTRMCDSICKEYNAAYQGQGDFVLNYDVLLSGAILHDIGKLLEWTEVSQGKFEKSEKGRYLRHPLSGMAIALRNGISYEIAHIIAYHAHEGNGVNRSPEAVIVAQVDQMNFDSIRSFLGYL